MLRPILLLSFVLSLSSAFSQKQVDAESVFIGNVVKPEAGSEISVSNLEHGMGFSSIGKKGFILYFEALHLYGTDTLSVLSAEGKLLHVFTARETWKGGPNATPLLEDDHFTLFYKKGENTRIRPEILIEGIVWTDHMITSSLKSLTGPIESTNACKINVNCSPEGDLFQDEKNGVVKILLKKGNSVLLASGALMNNTSLDNTPYILTSDNCANGATASDLMQTVFYFKYELPGCDTSATVTAYKSLTGATFIARGGVSCNLHSDFYLVRLNQMVPESYQPYLLGYDRSGSIADSVVCIHHRAGFFKQIATSFNPVVSSTYFGGTLKSHWKVNWSATSSGHASTGQGSIGAPLLDPDGRVIGVWSDGYSSCSNPGGGDYFGKLSVSWNQYQSTPSFRLKEWLDPSNTGQDTLDGMYPTAYPPEAGLTQSALNITAGDSIHFMDVSYGSPDQWEWHFQGGQPSQWNGQAPPIILYPTPGSFDVKLIVSNSYGEDTLVLSDLIKVYPVFDTITTVLDTQRVCADTFEIAVRVENLFHVRNASLTISIDTSRVRFIDMPYTHPEIDAAGAQAYLSGNNVWLTWPQSGDLAFIGMDTLAVLRFTSDTGDISLEWNRSRSWMCQYYDEQGGEFPAIFTGALLDAVNCGNLAVEVRYGNSKILPHVFVDVIDSLGLKYSVRSDSSGLALFSRVLPGSYIVSVQIPYSWGGANSTDALNILRHFVGLNSLQGIFLQAADVNGSGDVNATDALNVGQRFTDLISSFGAGDWIIQQEKVQIGTSGESVVIHVICTGDVDGSFDPGL